jgi:hypothetical protein
MLQEQESTEKLSIEEIRERNTKFYEEHLPYLEKELEYQLTLAMIEEAKSRRINAIAQQAAFFQKPKENEEKPE